MIMVSRRHVDQLWNRTNRSASYIFQNPHLIPTTPLVASIALTLKPVLTVDRIDVNNLESCFVEHLARPAVYRCLQVHLYRLGIQ